MSISDNRNTQATCSGPAGLQVGWISDFSCHSVGTTCGQTYTHLQNAALKWGTLTDAHTCSTSHQHGLLQTALVTSCACVYKRVFFSQEEEDLTHKIEIRSSYWRFKILRVSYSSEQPLALGTVIVRNSVLTLHDRYVHSPPTRARYAAEPRPVGDGWTTSARHEASPAETNTDRNA